MVIVFESGSLATPEGGVDFERIREIVLARLPELPRLRTKLRRVPLDGHPVWVDDQEFNLDFHLRQSSLPRPGNHEQLCRTAARIAAGRLDRSRPLWDCWVIEGLEGGRFALVLKMHKALASLEGADLLRALLTATDGPAPRTAGRFAPRPAPSPVELFRQEVVRRWSPSRRLVGRAMHLVRRPGRVGRTFQQQAEGMLKVLGYKLRPAGESPFDGNLSPHRSFAVQTVSLEDVQAIRHALGGKVHDVVLAVLSGALRRFVQRLHVSPTTVDLRAVTPILESSGEEAYPQIVELPIWEESAEVRLELLSEQTRRIRNESDLATGESISAGDEWNAARLFAIGARALKGIETGQLAILQSPGPQQPLYLDGARLAECYGILPLQDSSALGVTVLSYDGSLFFAFNSDPDIVKDVGFLSDAVEAELEELVGGAAAREPVLKAVTSLSA
jgi:WS/DGAT/MGAT family acyltransferase